VPATPVILAFEKAYAEPEPINAVKIRYIRRFVSYIADKHDNIYDDILAWPV
jgi:hypothetical protein